MALPEFPVGTAVVHRDFGSERPEWGVYGEVHEIKDIGGQMHYKIKVGGRILGYAKEGEAAPRRVRTAGKHEFIFLPVARYEWGACELEVDKAV